MSAAVRNEAAGVAPHPAAEGARTAPSLTPRGASLVSRAIKVVADVGSGLAAALVLVVVLVQVVGRLLGSPLPWTEEATRALFIWMVFLGLAASMRTADAARVTVFVGALPPAIRGIAVPIYVAACLVFFAVMGWTGAVMVRQQIVMGETAATLAIPMWAIGLIMPVSAVVATLAVLDSLRTRRAVIATESPDHPRLEEQR